MADVWKHLRRAKLDNGMVVLARLDRETGEEHPDAYADAAEAETKSGHLREAGVACRVIRRGPIHYIALDDAAEPRPKEDAQSVFVAKLGEIHDALDVLRRAADDHFGVDPEAVHWGHVGDLGWIAEQLADVRAFTERR